MISLITNFGQIDIELDREHTANTAENFVNYAKAEFYDNTIFHRVIPGFVIQGGGYQPGMVLKKTLPPIPNEAQGSLKNHRGTVAMARTGDPHSATSQFFINLTDNHFLDYKGDTMADWGYCVFGKVVNGMDVVDKMAQTATSNTDDHLNVPIQDIIIERVIVNEQP